MNIDMNKIFNRIKEIFKPKNIAEKIRNMPRLDQVYWSKVVAAILIGIIFGVSNFSNWPAVLVMFAIYVLISGGWWLAVRKTEPGIKVRSYFLKGLMQYLITAIALWTLILNMMYIPPADF
ncbi:MAG: hypothetical protein HGN29_14315 [Asgard group archaeon]|nr:hypothetical protein [Asgard group archaeon]